MAVEEAIAKAEERGLDLVEVAPAASPPVCRIMDYGKFRYEATRKERDARKARKTKASNEVREVRMKTRIGAHDRSAKTRQVLRRKELANPLGRDDLEGNAQQLCDALAVFELVEAFLRAGEPQAAATMEIDRLARLELERFVQIHAVPEDSAAPAFL